MIPFTLGKSIIYRSNKQLPLPCRCYSESRSKVLIIGSGWGGFRVARDLDKRKFEVQLVSPRNYFLFTPLLPSTAVGTLEFRAIQEPVRTIPGIKYFQAYVDRFDFESRKAFCNDAYISGHQFELSYDYLILAAGCETNTFNIKGVENTKNVFYLKQLSDSRSIRTRLIECFERASSPGATKTEIDRLLSFVVVGGGPTNIEFAAELYDFLKKDVSKWYPDLYHHARVTIVEASGHILGSFASSLVGYVETLFKSRRVHVLTGKAVSEIRDDQAILKSGEAIPFGLLVWSAGIRPVGLVQSLPPTSVSRSPQGRLFVDPSLRVIRPTNTDIGVGLGGGVSVGGSEEALLDSGRVFAIGDCAADSTKPLPQLAQVANQQGMYLARSLNEGILAVEKNKASAVPVPFKYRHMGSMASVGDWKGVFDSTDIASSSSNSTSSPPVKGFLAFLLWRGAYWTMQVSVQNKVLILMYWFKSTVFGRNISSF